MKRLLCMLCASGCALALAGPGFAVEMDSGDTCCFSAESFAAGRDGLSGICITRLPEPRLGTVMLGERTLRPGDVLTADQLAQLTFAAAHAEADTTAVISYLPVFADGVSGEATMTLSIRGRENKAPVAEDSAFETYKNLEVTGKLRVHDPEGQAMNFTVTRQPRRGTITIHEDGSFTYAPKKNKVGVDSFTFTAADPAGMVSRETTVTVTIMKPTDSKLYTDTAGKPCRFAAEWMKNTGIFIGESLDGSPCFSPEKPVNRGEFVTMLVKSLKIPTDPAVTETGYQDAPAWLKPYLAAAVRSGLTSRLPAREDFGAEETLTSEDAAAMLCAALEWEPADTTFGLTPGQIVTRADAAMALYEVQRERS